MPRYVVYRFDVTGLSDEQRNMLDMMVTTQAEASDYDVNPETSQGIENYPDLPVARLCPWCHAELADGQCGGEGEGVCTERRIVEDYVTHTSGAQPTITPEEYVRTYCEIEQIENALVPYRNDGLTYYDQLAYLVREYHDLPQPDRKVTRRLP